MSTLAPQLRVLLVFARAKDHDLEGAAGDVLDNMTGIPNFPMPPVLPPALFGARQDFLQAMADQSQGGTAATAEKNNKREALLVLLRQLAAYVQTESANDLAKLLSIGFEAASTNRAQSPLATPHIKDIKPGMGGQLLVQVTPVKNARTYELQFALMCGGGVPGPWQDGGLHADSRAIPNNGLTPGQTYMVQVRAVGGSTGYSDWSDPSSHMSM